MGVIPKARRDARADALDLGTAIEKVLGKYGPLDGLSLLSRVRAQPGDVTAAVVALVVSRRVRVDSTGRFLLAVQP